jgi:hypothetical protein
VGLRREDAELLVYLVDEEKDIYIGVRPLPPRTCPARDSPAESLSYLSVAESLRTGKWRPHRGLYRTKRRQEKRSRYFAVHPRCTTNSEKGLGLFLGRQDGALVADGKSVGEGTAVGGSDFVADGASIGDGSSVGDGTYVGDWASVASGALVGTVLAMSVADGSFGTVEALGLKVNKLFGPVNAVAAFGQSGSRGLIGLGTAGSGTSSGSMCGIPGRNLTTAPTTFPVSKCAVLWS